MSDDPRHFAWRVAEDVTKLMDALTLPAASKNRLVQELNFMALQYFSMGVAQGKKIAAEGKRRVAP